jgi:hypothetical protein
MVDQESRCTLGGSIDETRCSKSRRPCTVNSCANLGRDARVVISPEYYKLREQKVICTSRDADKQAFVVHFSGFRASIYYATFPSEYLSTIQTEGANALESKFKDPLPLHHTAPCNLMDPDARLQFLKEFITVVRCLADGNAPIGYLRRDGIKIHRRSEVVNEGMVMPPRESLMHGRRQNGQKRWPWIMRYKESITCYY